MNRKKRLEKALAEAFSPISMEVIDDSARHAGHAGAQPEGETHFRVVISATSFSGKTRVQRHRIINEALRAEFDCGLHALSICAKTPEEAESPRG